MNRSELVNNETFLNSPFPRDSQSVCIIILCGALSFTYSRYKITNYSRDVSSFFSTCLMNLVAVHNNVPLNVTEKVPE